MIANLQHESEWFEIKGYAIVYKNMTAYSRQQGVPSDTMPPSTTTRAVMYIKFLEIFVRMTRTIRMYPYKRSFLHTFGPEGRDTERTLIQRVQTYKNMIYLVKYESTVARDLRNPTCFETMTHQSATFQICWTTLLEIAPPNAMPIMMYTQNAQKSGQNRWK